MSDVPTHALRGLRAIAIFEATKGVIALAGAAALAAIGPDALQHELQTALARLGIVVQRGSSALLDAITPQTVHVAVAVGLVYAGMRLLEACGGTGPGRPGWAASARRRTCRSRFTRSGTTRTG